MTSWISLLGLALGSIGSAIVILPTFPAIESRIVDQNKIDQLEAARRKLSKGGRVVRNNPSFELISEVIENRWEQNLVSESGGFRLPEYEFSSEESSFREPSLVVYSIGQDTSDEEYPDLEQEIESIFVINMWIDDRIRQLKTVPIQRVRGIGFFLIVVSVFIQVGLSLP